ncbi:MAG: transglutaminase domain-containing protein [candidate division Zixibacteria bacterium]|nr:transglutaminase domain-containing protein [candidate division Zixibacteria bacterium]
MHINHFKTLIYILSTAIFALFGDYLYADKIRVEPDTLMVSQKERASRNSESLFSVFNRELSTEQFRSVEFLYKYMPLADLASLNPDDILENVDLAILARAEMPWGGSIPNDIFNHFVLPYRAAQEPYQRWRKPFYNELSERIKGLSMKDAALEINLWCFEHATFKQTSSFDQGPLTTIKTGYGRCEEEMILTICAMRSVGIPARSCHTPYWAHSDNNHAWVEVWVDGQWQYLGGCEPDYKLNKAWFDNPVKRAALVVSVAYGDYNGPEEKLRQYPRSTLLNSTLIYTDFKKTKVKIDSASYLPVENRKVYFMLVNFAGLLPLTVLETDKNGECELYSGKTDWIVWCGSGDTLDWKWVSSENEDTVFLSPKPIGDNDWSWSLDMHAPPKIDGDPDICPDSLWQIWDKKKSNAVKLRENYISIWEDSIRIDSLSRSLNLQYEKTDSIMQIARGNWREIADFIASIKQNKRNLAVELIEAMTDKDIRSVDKIILEDHFMAINFRPESEDSILLNRYEEYILNPRIQNEHIRKWRKVLDEGFVNIESSALKDFIVQNFIIEDTRDRFSSQLSPEQIFTVMRGTKNDRENLLIAIYRTRGIPSRRHPITGKPEVWLNNDWEDITFELVDDETKDYKPEGNGYLTLKYEDGPIENPLCYRHWSLSRLENSRYELMEFDYLSPISENSGPHDLPAGKYLLLGSNRLDNGDVLAELQFFSLNSGDSLDKTLIIRSPDESTSLQDKNIALPENLIPLEKWGTVLKLPELRNENILIFWMEPDIESSERMLDEFINFTKTSRRGDISIAVATSKFIDSKRFKDEVASIYNDWDYYIDPGFAGMTTAYQNITGKVRPEMPFILAINKNGDVHGFTTGLNYGLASKISRWFGETK